MENFILRAVSATLARQQSSQLNIKKLLKTIKKYVR